MGPERTSRDEEMQGAAVSELLSLHGYGGAESIPSEHTGDHKDGSQGQDEALDEHDSPGHGRDRSGGGKSDEGKVTITTSSYFSCYLECHTTDGTVCIVCWSRCFYVGSKIDLSCEAVDVANSVVQGWSCKEPHRRCSMRAGCQVWLSESSGRYSAGLCVFIFHTGIIDTRIIPISICMSFVVEKRLPSVFTFLFFFIPSRWLC